MRTSALRFRILGVVSILAISTLPKWTSAAASIHVSPDSLKVDATSLPPSPTQPPRAPRSGEAPSNAVVVRKDAKLAALSTGTNSGGGFAQRVSSARECPREGLKPTVEASLLTELTKPAYLHVRLLATPTNHRAPPA